MQHPRVLLAGVVVALAAVAVARPAQAQISDWKVVEVTPGEPTAKVKSPPPDIKIKVIGEPAPKDNEKDRFRLELDSSDNRRRYKGVAPTKMIPFNQSSDSLAIVLLIEGHPYYLGNTSYVTPVTPGAPPAAGRHRLAGQVGRGRLRRHPAGARPRRDAESDHPATPTPPRAR